MKEQQNNRITQSELNNAVFRPNQPTKIKSNVQNVEREKQKIEWFDSNGIKLPMSAKKEDVVAKRYVVGQNTDCFIQINNRGDIYNPHENMASTARWGEINTVLYTYRFVKCSSQTFKNYIEFLKTKNILFLRECERGIL